MQPKQKKKRGPRNPPPNKHLWTKFEENFIQANFFKLQNRQLAIMLGLSISLLRWKCYDMGLKRMELEYWSEEQIDFLKDNYRKYGDMELALMYEELWPKNKTWTLKHIEKKRMYLNLKRTKEELDAIREGHKQMGVFALGSKKTWATRGTASIGHKVLWQQNGRQYVAIKTEKGYVPYARWLYQQTYGEIPEGYKVRLIDGDPLNVVVENMELVTNAENAARNVAKAAHDLSDNWIAGILTYKNPELRPLVKQYPELIELKRNQLKLNRAINERKNTGDSKADGQ